MQGNSNQYAMTAFKYERKFVGLSSGKYNLG